MSSRVVRRMSADSQEPDAVRDGTAHEDVAPQRELVSERALLVDGLDAELPRLLDGETLDALATEQDLARIGRVDPGDDLDQRRLAGTVVTEQADNLARSELGS